MLKSNILKSPFKAIVTTSFASLFLVGLTPQFALAESVPPTDKVIMSEAASDADFKKLDLNSDAKISLKEAVKDKTLSTSFDMTDANKDGNITADEYASYKAASKMNSPEAAPAVNPVN